MFKAFMNWMFGWMSCIGCLILPFVFFGMLVAFIKWLGFKTIMVVVGVILLLAFIGDNFG